MDDVIETCPTCGKTVEAFALADFGLTTLTAYWHPGLDALADVRCNLPPMGPCTVVGCATVAEALAD